MTLSLSASAQRYYADGMQEYAYGSALELQGGFAGSIYNVNGEAGKASGLARGGEFKLRYTYYPGRHWGFFFDLTADNTSANGLNYFKVLNKADGAAYRYARNGYYGYGTFEDASLVAIQTGLAYRYDFGQWSLRPRIGVGIGSYSTTSDSYVRYKRDDSGDATFHYTYMNNDSRDYIEGNPTVYSGSSVPVLVTSASLQLTYSIGHHFFFSLEAGGKFCPTTIYGKRVTSQTKDAYNPQTWVEAVYDSELIGMKVEDPDTAVSENFSRMAGSMFNVNLGIGWNIGWNRYVSGKYARRR